MRGRRKADNIQTRGAVTQTRDRLAPIVPGAVAFDFFPGRALAVLNEPGAAPAGNDLALELGDGRIVLPGGVLYKLRIYCTSVRTPKPVPPLGACGRARSEKAGPAISRCAQGTPETNSSRNSAAVIAPP